MNDPPRDPQHDPQHDPFAPPRSAIELEPELPTAASDGSADRVRALGVIAALMAPVMSVNTAWNVDYLLTSQGIDPSAIPAAIVVALGITWLIAGVLVALLKPRGLRTLRALSAFGCAAFPVGTLFCPTVFYLTGTPECRAVFQSSARPPRLRLRPFLQRSAALIALGGVALLSGLFLVRA